MKDRIRIVDTTMRDGSHAMSHSFTREQVRNIAAGLDEAGLDIIEISHGDGIAGSSINYGFSETEDMELIEAAASVIKHARLGALLLPGIGFPASQLLAGVLVVVSIGMIIYRRQKSI